MAASWLETITGSLAQKRRYRESKARMESLPEPYARAAAATERYLMCYSGTVDGETLVSMSADLADLWERAATDGTPVRDIVGADPVEFAETFAAAYDGRQWIDKERARLTETFAAIEEQGS